MDRLSKVAVLGAGSWGTALAMVLADNGHEVSLWGRRYEQIEEINRHHTNSKYLPSITLPESIVGYHHLEEAVSGAKTILLVVPTKAVRETIQQLKLVIKQPVMIIHASKGIEPGTHKRISEMIEEEFDGTNSLEDIVVLSGPSHAEEVSLRQPTTVTVSSKSHQASEYSTGFIYESTFSCLYERGYDWC